MAIINKLHRIVGEKTATDSHDPSTDDPTIVEIRANDKEASHPVNEDGASFNNDQEKPTEDAQIGVRQIEAVTLAWTRGSMFTILVLYASNPFSSINLSRRRKTYLFSSHRIWFLTLINNMKSSMVYSLTAYATSSFMGHSLLTVITIVASAMTSAVYIPMAKALDLWGRAEGLLVMMLFCIIGLVLLAASKNLPTYCAGEVKCILWSY